MVVIGFEDVAIFRMREKEKKFVLKIVKRNQDVFESPSHFFRCAVIKELRLFDKKGRRVKL